ncbi:hypothetical protein AAY473_024262 [Plecturocebus cupreus]
MPVVPATQKSEVARHPNNPQSPPPRLRKQDYSFGLDCPTPSFPAAATITFEVPVLAVLALTQAELGLPHREPHREPTQQ